MTSPDDRIRDKIKALLRLAEDPGATEDERTNAMARVAVLVQKYQIDAAGIDPHSGQYTREDIVTHAFRYPTAYGLNSTHGHGLFDVLKAMGAQGYARNIRRGPKGQEEELIAYATTSTMDVLKILLPSLMLQEATARAQYMDTVQEHPDIVRIKETAAKLRKMGASTRDYDNWLRADLRRRRKSFCLAFYVEAAERIRKTRADAVQEAGRGYALVLVDTAKRIQQMLDGLSLRNQSARGQWSQHGWGAGSAAGAQALVGQTELHGNRPALGQ